MSESWQIGGVDLGSLLLNVSRLDTDVAPPLRGADRMFAYRAGRRFGTWLEDARTITLGGWIIGEDAGGDSRSGAVADTESAMRDLLLLLRPSPRGSQITVTRTWDDLDGPHIASALGLATGVDRVRVREDALKVTVDILLADPWFYGPEVSVPLTVGAPVVIDNPGDSDATRIWVDLDGALTNPTVTNSTPSPDVWVKVGSAVAAGDGVTVDVDATTVLRDSDGANLIGAVTHSGARHWLGLAVGSNVVTLTADGGTGSATFRFRPVYY